MIDAPSSPAAQVARNAEAKIAQITDELTALQAQSEGWRAEMRELLAERDEGQQRNAKLAATTNAARADLEHARLNEEMAAGTPLEAAAREATSRASELWDAARQDEHEALKTWGKRSAEIEDRLSFLQRSLDEAASMSQSLQARQVELRKIFDSAHADHGKDEQRALEAEFTAIAEKRAAIVQQLAEVDQEEQALRDQITTRLHEWLDLARLVLAAHLDYQPGPLHQALEHWDQAARLLGDNAKTVDWQTWEAHTGKLPAWYLAEFGPRAKIEAMPERHRDEPLKWYLRMLDSLAKTLDRLEQQERQAQITQRMREQGM